MKGYKIISSIVLMFIVILFSDCSITKRTYRPGYYVSWNKKAALQAKVAAIIKEEKNNNNELPLTVSANESEKFVEEIHIIKPLKLKEDSWGDIITLRNGEERIGKVMEINPKTIKYKVCDDADGPVVTMNKDDVFMIKYINGSKEVFKQEEKKPEHSKQETVVKSKTKQERQ